MMTDFIRVTDKRTGHTFDLTADAVALDPDQYTVVDDVPTSDYRPAVHAGEAPTAPPRGGAGSGEAEWRAYADQIGVDVSDADSRDAVIAAVDAHNPTTEQE